MKKIFLLTLMALLCSAYTLSQNVVKGYVRDAETDEPLVGVSVQIEGTLSGTQTGLNGEYSLQVEGNKTLIFSYVGYETRLIEASDATVADVKLKSTTIELKDVTVTSQIAIQRKTPVAVSNISFETIEEKLGNAEFPEVLKSTPGVYATKSGGGYGDSKINMRGFKSENIAVMVNGVPVNDMEWGGVYWSNWAGLSDVTRTMQTQRGLGASKVSFGGRLYKYYNQSSRSKKRRLGTVYHRQRRLQQTVVQHIVGYAQWGLGFHRTRLTHLGQRLHTGHRIRGLELFLEHIEDNKR